HLRAGASRAKSRHAHQPRRIAGTENRRHDGNRRTPNRCRDAIDESDRLEASASSAKRRTENGAAGSETEIEADPEEQRGVEGSKRRSRRPWRGNTTRVGQGGHGCEGTRLRPVERRRRRGRRKPPRSRFLLSGVPFRDARSYL